MKMNLEKRDDSRIKSRFGNGRPDYRLGKEGSRCAVWIVCMLRLAKLALAWAVLSS